METRVSDAGKVMLSIRCFISCLHFPLVYDPDFTFRTVPSSSFRSIMKLSLFPRLALAALVFVTPMRAVHIVAHRGASHDAPENTLAAHRLALAHGADRVETDVHLTSDGRLIVIHDKTTERTTGTVGKVAAMTQDELRRLDAGRWKGEGFTGERLPLLEEQLALITPGRGMLVELKSGPEIVPEFARVVGASGVAVSEVTVISFNVDTLRAVRRAMPSHRTLLVVGFKPAGERKANAPVPPTLDGLIATATAEGFTGLDLQHTWPLTADDAARVRAAGLELHVWTVDDPEVARRWMALGVASLTTNRAGWLRAQLGL
jgi:glycerophosphoryl diester phosphodiesterase